jgi:hypothetical protein
MSWRGDPGTKTSTTSATSWMLASVLSQRAHEIRGVVIHGLCVLNELQHVNGRLETLAAIRRCFMVPEEDQT